jgi:hypothetical protein
MSLGHSKFGFCFACGAPTCMCHNEIDFKLSELYRKTGQVHASNEVDLSWLDPKLIEADSKFRFSNEKSCTCGNGYSMFCPEHGIYK